MPRADYAAGIDTFTVIVVVGLVLMVLAVLALGMFYPGSGAEQLDWKPTRSPQVEAQNEVDDVAQMIEAANERRRRLGKPERTLEQVEMSVMEAQQERRRLAAEAAERDADIDDMLALKNARRARKGLPALTREEYEAGLR